jgi:transposase
MWKGSSSDAPGSTCTKDLGHCVCEDPPTTRARAFTRRSGSSLPLFEGSCCFRDWLASFEVRLVGLEATGVYWKPVYYLLEDDFECWLLNARHLKNVPGRKTDVKDAEWICQLVEHGLVRPSFVPPKEIRELRNLTRYRKAQIEERTREVQRLEKVLQDARIKLSSVATRVLGASGRAMLDALVSGTTDPEVLAELARGRLRSKLPALQAARAPGCSGGTLLLASCPHGGQDTGSRRLPRRVYRGS